MEIGDIIVSIDAENYESTRPTRDQIALLPFVMDNEIESVIFRTVVPDENEQRAQRRRSNNDANTASRSCLSVDWSKECSKCGYMHLNSSFGGLLANCCYGGR